MNKLYIVIPAYNEEETIELVVKQWYPIIQKIGNHSRLLIIDDGSRDRTSQILTELSKDHPSLIPVTKANGGHGAAVLYGYRYALEHGADYVFQTDSDGQTLPEEFWDFWKRRERYDLIIGHRDKRQDGQSRIFVTQILKLVIYLCFHVKVKDANTPYRLMSASSLKDNIRYIPKDYNLSNVILTVLYIKRNYSYHFIPISFLPRQGGVNSINLKRIIKIGVGAIRDFIRINRSVEHNRYRRSR